MHSVIKIHMLGWFKKIAAKAVPATLVILPLLAAVTPHIALAAEPSAMESFIGGFLTLIYYITVGLMSSVAALAAFFLNFAVSLSLDGSIYGLDFISEGWTMLRDIGNMAFIFILLFIAIKVMFDANTAGTIQTLVKVIAVALIINFSFFATRVVIDAGNLLSIQFYNAVVAGTEQTAVTINNSVVPIEYKTPDLTKKIMDGVKFDKALGPDSFQNAIKNKTGDEAGLWVTFGAFAFIYIALAFMLMMLAMAFVAAGTKFLIRIVSLWFAIVTAPLALVAWAFQGGGGGHGGGHGGGGYFLQWRTSLLSNAFYPAVFLFVFLMISNFMSASEGGLQAGFLTQGAVSDTSQTGIVGVVIILANIAMRVGFVLVMLYFAIKSSDIGTHIAGSTWANTIAPGIVPAFMRGTVGRMANRLNQDVVTITGRELPGIAKLSKVSFDPRNTKILGEQGRNYVQKDFGKGGGQGGYLGDIQRRAEEKAKNIKAGQEGLASEVAEQRKAMYESKGGKLYQRDIGRLEKQITKLTKQSEVLAQRSDMAANARVKQVLAANSAAAAARAEESRKEITKLEGIRNSVLAGTRGKDIVDERNKARLEAIVTRLKTSGSMVNYATSKELTKKPKKGGDHGDEHGDEHAADHGGGGNHAAGGAGGAHHP